MHIRVNYNVREKLHVVLPGVRSMVDLETSETTTLKIYYLRSVFRFLKPLKLSMKHSFVSLQLKEIIRSFLLGGTVSGVQFLLSKIIVTKYLFLVCISCPRRADCNEKSY